MGCCCSRGKWGAADRSSPLSLEVACRALQWDDIVPIFRRSQTAEYVEKGPLSPASGVVEIPLRRREEKYHEIFDAIDRGSPNTITPTLLRTPTPTATMSRASKLTLLGTSLFAAGTVTFVHWQQRSEKDVCT